MCRNACWALRIMRRPNLQTRYTQYTGRQQTGPRAGNNHWHRPKKTTGRRQARAADERGPATTAVRRRARAGDKHGPAAGDDRGPGKSGPAMTAGRR